ncbi:MAG TPA: hypothetical protein VK501_26875 [Baekduia sp.]|uniref:DUF3592 domain-containing protein n=1 Tax=Baekduia sp. TaxID=2600305 RepID=UPI002C3CC57B|nr:hypothetical protein [Baekduia sp.]HMJ37559.1 hypothetical protein [Baekduia sp.]
MGFLKDIRNLEEQAGAMVPPEHRAVAGGRIGTATIQAVRDAGTTVDDDPIVELDLSVSVGGGPAYAVTHEQAISRSAIASFQPGGTVPVRVDPADPSSLTIG